MEHQQTTILASFILGAVHALEPGHGKAFMAGVLASSTRPLRDSSSLALGTAGGHTLGLLVFTVLAYYLGHLEFVEAIHSFAGVVLGIFFLYLACAQAKLIRVSRGSTAAESNSCPCCRQPGTRSDHNSRILPAVGFATGFLPCPSAIALAIAAIGVESLSGALFSAVSFGCGVAVVLGLLGLAVSFATPKLYHSSSVQWWHTLLQWLPAACYAIFGAYLLLHVIID